MKNSLSAARLSSTGSFFNFLALNLKDIYASFFSLDSIVNLLSPFSSYYFLFISYRITKSLFPRRFLFLLFIDVIVVGKDVVFSVSLPLVVHVQQYEKHLSSHPVRWRIANYNCALYSDNDDFLQSYFKSLCHGKKEGGGEQSRKEAHACPSIKRTLIDTCDTFSLFQIWLREMHMSARAHEFSSSRLTLAGCLCKLHHTYI